MKKNTVFFSFTQKRPVVLNNELKDEPQFSLKYIIKNK